LWESIFIFKEFFMAKKTQERYYFQDDDPKPFSEEDIILIKQQENKWHYINDLNCEILSITFNDNKFFFKVEDGNFDGGYTGVICYSDLQSIRLDDEPFVLPGDGFLTDEAKKMVENTIEHFTGNEKITVDYINNHLKAQVDQLSQQQQESSQNVWKTNSEDDSQVLSHIFNNSQTVFFKIETGNFYGGLIGLNCLPNDPLQMTKKEKWKLLPDITLCNNSDFFDNDMKAVKNFVSNTIKHFTEQTDKNFTFDDIKNHLESHIKQHNQQETVQQHPWLETAQKTGYVQGVCESVLAFNTDENRKIMSDSTMNFLSKKLLSEMNVTKDMAQKFAHPETYKALEHCVFAPKQEQYLEQTQSRRQGL
jgi:hypothetical protein